MTTLTPFFWFDTQAEEAANFYASIFPDGKVTGVTRYGPNMPMPEGTAMVAEFEILGMKFVALNGGPQYPPSGAISFQIPCADQAEVDHYWDALSSGGGKPGPCGWITDRFGFTWQVTPTALIRMMSDPDRQRAGRATQAMMGMGKIDIAALQKAFDGG